jgi:hypothetical protein
VFDKKNWLRTVPCGTHIDVSFEFGGLEVLICPPDSMWGDLVMGVRAEKLRASDPRVYPFYYRTILS